MKNLKRATRLALIAISFLFLASTQARASHFRYATVDYKPILDVNGNPTGTVEFHIRSGWRRSAFGTPVVGSVINPESFFFGDGGSVTVSLTVTSFSATEDWVLGTFTVQHHYVTTGPFTAMGNSGARISTLQDGHDENWRYDTLVFPFSKNNSPSTSLPPVIPVVKNSVNQFFVPVSDLDRDNLQFSIAPRANTGVNSTLYPPPGLSINSSTGLITWNTSTPGVVPGLWFVQVWVADLDANNNVKSRVPIDFLMDNSLNAGGSSPSCLINGLSSPASFSVSPGTHISFAVTGSSPNINPATGNADTPVTLNVSGLPTGATMTPSLSFTGPSPVSSTFNWTPTAADGGARTITYTATDSQGRQTFNSVNVFVETNQPPTVSCPAPISQHAASAAGATVNVLVTVQDTNGDTLTVTWTVDGNVLATHSVANTASPTTDTLSQLFSIGTHTVSVSVSDGKAAAVTCSTTVTVSNSTPVAQGQSVTTNEDTPLNITLAATDTDGDTLTYSFNTPSHGTLSGTAPNLVYTPNPNYGGSDSFTFNATDGINASAPATISITVNPVNDPPTASCRDLTLTTSGGGAACPPGMDCKQGPGTKHCKAGDPTCIPTVGSCSLNVSGEQVDNGSSDPDGDDLTYTLSPAGPFTVGTTPVTLTVTDPDGASSSCSAHVTVTDDTLPIPTVAKLDDVTGECSVALTPPTAVDDCAGTIQGTTTNPLTYNQPGTYTITWTYDDGHGNVTTQNQQAIVQDTTPPVVPNLPGSPQTFNWVSANTPAGAPSARTGHRMVYDPVRHKVILFGGHDSAVHPTGNYVLTSHLNDVWELDTATNVWTNVTPSSGPMPVGRADFGMAYDVARNKVVIFGGEIDGWLTGDTWEWDPAAHAWEEKTAASVPVYGGLFGPAMAYDPNRHQVILFGGRAYYNWGQAGTYAWDGTNWIDVTPAVYPPPRFIHAMATDLARSRVVMFGGKNNEYPLTDAWEWDGSAWTQVIPVGPVPPARDDPSMAYDAARQVTVLFGGYEHSDNDTWSWDGRAWSLLQPQISPSTRSTAIVYDPSQSKLVLFSGDLQSDTWYSQTTSGLPTITGECSATVTAPVATDNCSGPITGTTSDPTTYTSQGTYTIHWIYDDGHGNTSTQTQTVIVKDTMAPVPDAASLPDITAECSSGLPPAPTATDNCDGRIVGVPDKTGPFGQGDDVITWTFTDHVGNHCFQTQAIHVHDTTPPQINGLGSNFSWLNVNVPTPGPAARSGHQMVYDSTRNKVILFGGQTIQGCCAGGQTLAGQLLNDMWEWDGNTRTWTQITPASGPTPPARSFFGMAYDPNRRKVLIYGGKEEAIYYNTNDDTWEWDPATRIWTSLPAAGSITYGGLRGVSLAFDPNLQQVILFGGIMYWGGHEGATWAFDGAHWILKSTSGPEARTAQAMATDFARSRVVLFGGYDYTANDYHGAFYRETWEWNGSSWTMAATTGPAGRYSHGMAFDGNRGVVIMFGGTPGVASNDAPQFNETWEWNGSSWALRAMLNSPAPRDTVLTFDGNTTMMFGGRQSAQTTLGDTWLIEQTGSAEITVDNDHDRCSAVVNFPTPTATDSCGTVTVTTSPVSGSVFPVGTSVVTVTATDINGNRSTRPFNVTVRDAQAPTPDSSSLPDVVAECSANLPAAPTATDNCDGRIAGVPDKTGPFGQGEDLVTWTFTDSKGNRSTQTQAVHVHDTTAPVPDAASLPDVTGQCSANLPAAPAATDACDGRIVGVPDKTGPFAQGDDLITWTFTDSKGNRHTQTQAVHVHDTMSPVPDAASLPDVTGECSAAITAIPKATDNCSGPINGTTTDSLVYGEQGTFIVTWHFKDSNGNESTQTQKVIVKDTTAPELSVPADATFGTGPDATSCSTIVSDATIGSANATDNCGLQSLTRSGVPAGNVFPVGTTTITYTATDIHGKVTTGSQKVTVLDNTKPILNVPANIIVATAADATSCTAFVDNARLTPTATDNCGVDLNSFTRTGVPAGNNFPVGISQVTYTVKDIHGNLTSGTQTVTVTDATLPVITFTGKTITLWSPDHKYQTVKITDLIASATDNCDPNVNLSKVVISMVTSDEPENINSGDGNTFNDIVIAPDCKSVDLRAERDGSRNGRVYTIYFAVKDSAGNMRTIKATVAVPKSQGPGGAAIDDTPAYPLPPPYQVMGSCPP